MKYKPGWTAFTFCFGVCGSSAVGIGLIINTLLHRGRFGGRGDIWFMSLMLLGLVIIFLPLVRRGLIEVETTNHDITVRWLLPRRSTSAFAWDEVQSIVYRGGWLHVQPFPYYEVWTRRGEHFMVSPLLSGYRELAAEIEQRIQTSKQELKNKSQR